MAFVGAFFHFRYHLLDEVEVVVQQNLVGFDVLKYLVNFFILDFFNVLAQNLLPPGLNLFAKYSCSLCVSLYGL